MQTVTAGGIVKSDVLQGEAYACCNLGVLQYRQRLYDDALTYFERFFEAARALQDQHVLDVARVNLGSVRAALTFKDYIQARSPPLSHAVLGSLEEAHCDCEQLSTCDNSPKLW